MDESNLENKLDRIIEQQDEIIKLLKVSNERQNIQEHMSEEFYKTYSKINSHVYGGFRRKGGEKIKEIVRGDKKPWER
ncbi:MULTISPECIES: hypothetical protein [Bacillati]|jgi:hypothetical protein|uniref:hypothetical protein n=1 Tax=Bacillati TaxID=1783272 RepID=UPI001430AE7E|nr:hypothetical protein [Staphylococcus epidermidis]MBG1652052.1 hypothetical protein [Staphylococcus aureus]MCG1165075.1 hypothetical protein [Staphylococcus epidermidis]MCG2011196.1 hypothetical protein [Staphylococcus epidermidis]MCG2085491.1 hypothetical protein [Staphylococcus epidermidis]MCG2254773.1 hypothetical protein [Staphylococcus epidermidis]